jgi:hypothetical protein
MGSLEPCEVCNDISKFSSYLKEGTVDWLMQFREITIVYADNHKKPLNILRGKILSY